MLQYHLTNKLEKYDWRCRIMPGTTPGEIKNIVF